MGNELYLAASGCIIDDFSFAPAQMNRHEVVGHILMVGYLDGMVYILVRNPNVPRPKNCVLTIFNGYKRISLSDIFFVYLERNRTTVGSAIILNVGYQRRGILPNQFSFYGDAICIFSDIRVGYAIAKMINERVQRPLYGSLRRVCRVIDLSIIDGIAVYQRERIRARCIYDVTVCRVFHVCRTRTVRQVVRNGFRTFLCCCTKGCRMYTLGYTGLWSNFSVKGSGSFASRSP